MKDEFENIPGRHRFGENYAGPLTLRDFMREANWAVIAAIVFVVGFWAFVGYGIAQWWPG